MAEKHQAPYAPQAAYAPEHQYPPQQHFAHQQQDAPPPQASQPQYVPQQQNGHQHAHEHQHQHGGKSDWSNSFWACCTPFDTCMCAFCCSCFLFGKTQARLKDPSLKDFSLCNGMCCGFCCLAYVGCSCILQALQRTKMRETYNIEGSSFMDFLASCCCPCCGLVQSEKEAVARKSTGGYQAPPQMTYP